MYIRERKLKKNAFKSTTACNHPKKETTVRDTKI
jgi:hypothetical protein